MVRRPSVAGADNGAEYFAHPAEPAASAVGRDELPGLGFRRFSATRREGIAIAGRTPRGQVRLGAPRLAATYDISVVDRLRRRWYLKGHPCIYAADGNPMTRFAPPGRLTDVHGREG